jgi:Anthranilate/para-aminobenzoate synthases component II
MIYVIDHNDSFTHNVVHQFALFDKVECDNYDKVNENKIKQASTIIFSPGPGNPKNYPITSKIYKKYTFQHTGLAVVLQGLVRPRLRGTELEFWRNSEEARTDRPSQQLRSLNGEWRLMRYFLLTHLCGISHRIWCTLSTICSDAA